jgi:A/G-specific adenine glycosylase
VDLTCFRQRLRTWFQQHARDLPWRRTRDPYAILVSEMMLQQTTVAAVVPFYERWMKRFPSVQKLAAAEESEVLALWQGLGYYRRARNLLTAAKKISSQRKGKFPCDYDGLRALPGVGDYTANAVLAFSRDQCVPVLDANVIRVVARLFNQHTPVDTARGLARVRSALVSLLPESGGHEFASALMELGALVCRAGRPDCLLCPVKECCAARHPEQLPRKAPKSPIKERAEYAAWVSDGKSILLQQAQARRWVGLWRLPPLISVPDDQPAAKLVFGIVRERVTLQVHPMTLRALGASGEPRQTFSLRGLDSVAIPSPHRRAIARMMAERHN